MEKEYFFYRFKIKSSVELNNKTLNFLFDMDKWLCEIENKIAILQSKEYKSEDILKLFNIQMNILSEIDIALSNSKINFKIEII